MPYATRTVKATASGYVTSSGKKFAADALLAALDEELVAIAKKPKPLYFRGADGELDGEMRWLHACSVEGAPLRGTRIDEQAIAEMAADLNSSPRAVPINGGPTPPGLAPSRPHGDVVYGDSSEPANGRAQWAVVVERENTTDLYLYSELMPHIAAEVDRGRLAEGSVAFDWESKDGDAPRGVHLISHALTNDPAVTTLEPSNSIRSDRRVFNFSGAMRSARHPKGIRMSKPTVARMSFADAEATIAALLPDVDKAELGTALIKLVAAKAEMAAPVEAESAEGAERTEAPVAPVALAEGAPPPDAAKAEDAKAISDVVSAYEKATGKTGAKIEDVIAWIAEMGNAAPAGEPPAGMSAERARSSAELTGLRTRVQDLEARVAKADAAEALAADERWFDAEIAKRGLAVPDADRKAVFAAREKLGADWRVNSASVYISARHRPPTGSVMAERGAEARSDATPASVAAATDAEMEAARKAALPGELAHVTRARAQRMATAKHPALFGHATSEPPLV